MLAPTTTRTLRLFVSATSRCSIEASEWIELVYLTLKFGYTEQNKIIFFCDFVPVASIPGCEGAIAPPIKIYLGESIFSPPQSFSWTAKKLHQECTTNRHFEIAPPKNIYLDWRRCFVPISGVRKNRTSIRRQCATTLTWQRWTLNVINWIVVARWSVN